MSKWQQGNFFSNPHLRFTITTAGTYAVVLCECKLSIYVHILFMNTIKGRQITTAALINIVTT